MPALTVTDLNNAALDLDHIAAVATSTSATATDRIGNVKPTVSAAVNSLKAFNSRGAWVAATAYAVKDLVTSGGTWYACVVAHVSSGAFGTDSASKWRVHQGLTAPDLATGVPVDIAAQGFAVGTPLPGSIARFYAKEAISEHAHYGFLDESQIHYSVPGFFGHASFDDNITITGPENSDHHHSFQAYPHISGTGFTNRVSCFWAIADVTAGVVTELSLFKANNPAGAGSIITLYGLFIPALTRGTNNYGVFVAGNTPSRFEGELQLGAGNKAQLAHNPTTENLDITPLATKGVRLVADAVMLGRADAYVTIKYDPDTGHLVIAPRTGYSTQFASGDLKIVEAGKGVVMSNAAGTVTRRVRLNDAGDGFLFGAV